MFKISVIIPFYNVERYIADSLGSVLQQSYRPLECILVDDGSTDGSKEKAVSLIEQNKDSGIECRLIDYGGNKGVAYARNAGLDAATGEYVLYVDSDDVLADSESIAKLASQVTEWPEVEMVFGSAYSIPPSFYVDRMLSVKELGLPPRVETNREVRDYFFNSYKPFGISNMPVNKLFSRRFLFDNGLRFPEGLVHEDVCQMHYLVNCLSRMACVEETTYVYRRREDSITALPERRRYTSWNAILTKIVGSLDKEDHQRQCYFYFRHFICRYCVLPDRSLWRSTYRLFLREAWHHGYYDMLALQLLGTCTLAFGKGGRLIPQLTKKMLHRQGIR